MGVLNAFSYFGQVYFALDPNQLWPYYLFALAFASFVTGSYFRDKLQFKLFVLFLGFGFITLAFVQSVINLIWFIVLMIIWFIAYFAFNIISKKRRVNNG